MCHVSKIVGNQSDDWLVVGDWCRHERVQVQQPVKLQTAPTSTAFTASRQLSHSSQEFITHRKEATCKSKHCKATGAKISCGRTALNSTASQGKARMTKEEQQRTLETEHDIRMWNRSWRNIFNCENVPKQSTGHWVTFTVVNCIDVASRRHLLSTRHHHYGCVSTQSQLVWASGICCCRPNYLELTERWSE